MYWIKRYDNYYGPYSLQRAINICGILNYIDQNSSSIINANGNYVK